MRGRNEGTRHGRWLSARDGVAARSWPGQETHGCVTHQTDDWPHTELCQILDSQTLDCHTLDCLCTREDERWAQRRWGREARRRPHAREATHHTLDCQTEDCQTELCQTDDCSERRTDHTRGGQSITHDHAAARWARDDGDPSGRGACRTCPHTEDCHMCDCLCTREGERTRHGG